MIFLKKNIHISETCLSLDSPILEEHKMRGLEDYLTSSKSPQTFFPFLLKKNPNKVN